MQVPASEHGGVFAERRWSVAVLLGGRVAASLALFGIFALFGWTWARAVLVWSVTAALAWLGDTVVRSAEFVIEVNGKPFVFSRDCTYIDLFLLTAPFLWRARASTRANAARLVVGALTIMVVNLARVVFAVHLSANGHARALVHDLPDYVLYWPTLFGCAFVSLARDWRSVLRDAPRKTGPSPEGARP